jgi:hypothetical protein
VGIALLLWTVSIGCTQRTVYEYETVEQHQMEDAHYLRRLSLDLRGRVPTIEEWSEFDALNPQRTIDLFLEDDGFGSRIRSIYAPIYRTVTDQYTLTGADFQWEDEILFRRSIGEEPLRLLSHVAENNLPWTTIVTADYTMANPVLGSIFPVAYDGAVDEEWQAVPYVDGRPMAGVLSSNALWWRFGSTNTNANRMRANVASTILLCNNYLSRPISFERDSNLLEEEAVQDAINNDPACVNCHRTLDPLAAHFFGFWNVVPDSWIELSTYHVDREQYWQTYLETPPEYFGQPSAGFADLGWLIASDSRFPNCATEQMASALLQQSFDFSDAVALLPYREAFLSSGLQMKALVSSIVQSDAYRAGKWNDAQSAQNKKMLSIDQLVSSIEDLTGFRWTYGDFDMFGNDIVGLRSLAGGIDGRSAGKEAMVPNATILLVQSLLAEQAASYTIQLELAQEVSDRKMFSIADLTLDIDADSETLSSAEVSAILNLWRDVYTLTRDPVEAWTVVLTALLRDPDYLLY